MKLVTVGRTLVILFFSVRQVLGDEASYFGYEYGAEETKDPSPYFRTGFESMSARSETWTESSKSESSSKRKYIEIIDLVGDDGLESDEALALKDQAEITTLPIQSVLPILDLEEPVESSHSSQVFSDLPSLAKAMGGLFEVNFKAVLTSFGEDIRSSIKDNCDWNLLHEAVYTDNLIAAKILLRDFNFNPNQFDPLFGSAMYLIQSDSMADLLIQFNGNILDERPCQLYSSCIDSSIRRGKLSVYSKIEKFPKRYHELITALRNSQAHTTDLKFEAKREEMFRVSLGIMSRRRSGYVKAEVKITFTDEAGVDAGGLTRDFINHIKLKLIEHAAVLKFDDSGRYHLIPDVDPVTKKALKPAEIIARDNELKLFGFIIGLSIYHKVPLNIEFAPIVYYVLCGLDPNRAVTDWSRLLRETDAEFYQNQLYVGKCSDEERQDFSFPQVDGDSYKPWKRVKTDVKTTEDVKNFWQLTSKTACYLRYQNVLKALKAGFDSAIHSNLISRYITPAELKLLITGESDYKAAQWRAACKPPTHDPKHNLVFEWFWEIVDELSREQRANLLKFMGALVSLPVGGFGVIEPAPSVYIIQEADKVDLMPKSSTCSFQIRLYPASSKEKLRELLLLAIEYGNGGFEDQ